MNDAETVRREMNRCGAARRPFLFGVDFELHRGFFVEEPLRDKRLLFAVGNVTNAETAVADTCPPPELHILHSDAEEYARKFRRVREGLLRGDSFLLNLTERTPIATNLTPEQIFRYSRAKYKLLFPGRFVCFSPESFVRIQGNEIASYPMKGTIDAKLPDAERTLMESYKELCEHYTITDLIRNDLNMVAEEVRVRRFRYVESIRTLRGEILQTGHPLPIMARKYRRPPFPAPPRRFHIGRPETLHATHHPGGGRNCARILHGGIRLLRRLHARQCRDDTFYRRGRRPILLPQRRRHYHKQR